MSGKARTTYPYPTCWTCQHFRYTHVGGVAAPTCQLNEDSLNIHVAFRHEDDPRSRLKGTAATCGHYTPDLTPFYGDKS